MKRRIAVLVSGGGRSLENLVQRSRSGRFDAEVALCISDRTGIGALERADRLEVPHQVIAPKDYTDAKSFSRDVFQAIEDANAELCVLAGFLRLLPVPPEWEGRVINIHPSLLPAFGGKGYYGDRVHRAVLERGVWFTGCTVHYVTNEYDRGPILLQRCVRVEPGDTVESLGARVFAQEEEALPEAILAHFSKHPR